MTQRCVIERDATAGEADTSDWQPHLDGVSCRLWATAGREATDQGHTAVVEDLRLVVPLGLDVTVLDRIHGVVNRAGGVIDPRPLGIEAILRERDHLELVLQSATL